MSTIDVGDDSIEHLLLDSPVVPILTLVYGPRFTLTAVFCSHRWRMEQTTTQSMDVALKTYLSIVNNILCEHGRVPLCGTDEIALVSNMFQSHKSYVDSVITVLILRQDCGFLPRTSLS